MVAGLLVSSTARGATGVLVRLQNAQFQAHEASVHPVVILRPPAGAQTRIPLLDDGRRPDVTADDGWYAGAQVLDGHAFEVSLEIEGRLSALGTARFADDGQPRDLTITPTDDGYEMSGATHPTAGTEEARAAESNEGEAAAIAAAPAGPSPAPKLLLIALGVLAPLIAGPLIGGDLRRG